MAIYKNSFEGGTDGATITTANSGNGDDDAFATSIGASSTLTYATESAFHGTLGMRLETTATGVQTFVQQDIVAGDRVVLRFYFKIDSLPNSTCVIGHLRSTAGTVAQITINNTNRLCVTDSASATISGTLATNPITAGTWYRVEVGGAIGASATTGTIDFAYYLGDNTTAVFNVTAPNANVGTNQISKYRLGKPSAGNTYLGVLHFDDVKATEELEAGYVGPEVSTDPVISGVIYRNDFEGSADGTTITSGNSGNNGNTSFATNIPTGSTITYASNAALHGSFGGKIETTTTNLSPFLLMDIAAADRNAFRFYFRSFSSIPSATCAILQVRTASGTAADVRFSGSSGKLVVADAANTEITGTRTTNALSADTWYRIEIAIEPGLSTTSGTVNFAYYPGDDTTPIDSFTVSSLNLGSAQTTKFRIGKPSGGSHIGVFYFDDVAAQSLSSGYIGPAITTGAYEKVWSGSAWIQSSEADRVWNGSAWT